MVKRGEQSVKFSVVMPAYNAQAHIEQAVHSVLNQSYKNLELIVVDDGSQDDTLKILTELRNRDSRLIIIRQPNSGKPASARNSGLAHVTGDILTFLDSDDLYHERRLEAIAHAFAQGAYYVIHDISLIDASGTIVKEKCFENNIVRQHLEQKCVDGASYNLGSDFLEFFLSQGASVHTSSIAAKIRNPAHALVPFREDFVCAEDLIMWAHFISLGGGVYLNEALSQYRDTPGSVTKDRGRLDFESYRYYCLMLELYKELLSNEAKLKINVKIKNELLGAAYEYSVAGRRSRAIYLSFKAFLRFADYETFIAFLKTIFRLTKQRTL